MLGATLLSRETETSPLDHLLIAEAAHVRVAELLGSLPNKRLEATATTTTTDGASGGGAPPGAVGLSGIPGADGSDAAAAGSGGRGGSGGGGGDGDGGGRTVAGGRAVPLVEVLHAQVTPGSERAFRCFCPPDPCRWLCPPPPPRSGDGGGARGAALPALVVAARSRPRRLPPAARGAPLRHAMPRHATTPYHGARRTSNPQLRHGARRTRLSLGGRAAPNPPLCTTSPPV